MKASLSIETGANIIPFAQAEMVHNFMTGIDPDLENKISRIFRELLEIHGEGPIQVPKTIVIMNVILQSLNVGEKKSDEIKGARQSGNPEKEIFQDEGKNEAAKIWKRALARLEEDKKSS